MAEIILLEELRIGMKKTRASALRDMPVSGSGLRETGEQFVFPSTRAGITGNLGDLYEQAHAVLARHYAGDAAVPKIVAAKCLELLKALSEHANAE